MFELIHKRIVLTKNPNSVKNSKNYICKCLYKISTNIRIRILSTITVINRNLKSLVIRLELHL